MMIMYMDVRWCVIYYCIEVGVWVIVFLVVVG